MNTDLAALAVTIGHAKQLLAEEHTPKDWAALTGALVDEHTPEQLANMLTGAATLLAMRG